MADWLGTVIGPLTDAQILEMLETEHGGIMEVVADVYAITGDARTWPWPNASTTGASLIRCCAPRTC